jgi:hypothetical protein
MVILRVAALLLLGIGVSERLAGQGAGALPHAWPRDGATPLFENVWVSAWNVMWADGVSTPMHRHRFDYFGVELETARARVTDADGTSRDIAPAAGVSWFLPKGTTHIETGLGDSPRRHAIIFDLKDAAPAFVAKRTGHAVGPEVGSAAPFVANPRVTMWSVTWSPNQPSAMRYYDRNVVFVFPDGGALEETDADGRRRVERVAAGHVKFLSAGESRALRAQAASVRVVIVQLEK